MAEHSYLTPAEAADHYRTTEDTLRYWRYKGKGPKFIRAGARVLYPRAEIERYDRQLACDAAIA